MPQRKSGCSPSFRFAPAHEELKVSMDGQKMKFVNNEITVHHLKWIEKQKSCERREVYGFESFNMS